MLLGAVLDKFCQERELGLGVENRPLSYCGGFRFAGWDSFRRLFGTFWPKLGPKIMHRVFFLIPYP